MHRTAEIELKHVIYISRPTHFDHLVLEDILTKSRSNNPAIGVTGNLIYHADLFLQLLEGPPLAVHKLYQTILADNRHADIVNLRDETFSRRLFASWAMRDDPVKTWMWTRDEVSKGILNDLGSEDAMNIFTRHAKEVDQFL